MVMRRRPLTPEELIFCFVLILGLAIGLTYLICRDCFKPRSGEEISGNLSIKKNLKVLPIPSELKEALIDCLPTKTEVEVEIKRFKEARGYEPEGIVIGVPPSNYSKEEVRELLNRVEQLWEEGYQVEISWSIYGNMCLCYISMLAEELGKCPFPVRVHYAIRREDEVRALDVIRILKRENISVWVRPFEKKAKLVEVPSKLDLEGLRSLLNASGSVFEGKNVSVITKGHGEGNWERDKIYHGWICVLNYGFDHEWWYWLDCKTKRPSGCRAKGPSELSACDIHYMREMYFYGELGSTNGLIDFPGCEPAKNLECMGNCGVINTLWMGRCELDFSKLPLEEEFYYMYASYIPTHTKRSPFPYFDYCGCLGNCPDPQIFIIDIRYVLSP